MSRSRMLAMGLLLLSLAGLALVLVLRREASTLSPYVDQRASPVRGLSSQEVDDLLNGRGAGYARTAELNSYPGPRHLLDLAAELELSAEQTALIQTVFDEMQREAQGLGAQIVAGEQDLSAQFAQGAIADASLDTQVRELGALYGELRAIHLHAHLQVRPLLLPEQIAAYDRLRGYTSEDHDTTNQHQHK